MDQIVSKITNLGYELFGVLLPGVVAATFLALWWAGLGPLAPTLSNGFFPQLTSENTSHIFESIGVRTGVGVAIPSLMATYFLGHILLWIGRSGKSDNKIVRSPLMRTYQSLTLRIPKPEDSYDPNLKPLLEKVSQEFSINGVPLSWPQFYPVVKNHISRNASYSLISTYQNKYTLHRSITLAAASLFWLATIGLFVGLISSYCFAVQAPRWGMLSFLTIFSIVLVWGFSDSYAYNWKLFGNSIITESYSMMFGPSSEKSNV